MNLIGYLFMEHCVQAVKFLINEDGLSLLKYLLQHVRIHKLLGWEKWLFL
jgi:hypothetical protein